MTTQELYTIHEIELIYKNPFKPSERPKVQEAGSAVKLLISMWDMSKIELQEEVKINS